ncbi:S9 family peptidase [Betaproteobacteria bacterium PRO7]|jgi:dipeptidyl aminopeptidase/acylaminoacyl peptidase|nr:S9 family peptidase [Betaproteobacteria bacterium PRO7]
MQPPLTFAQAKPPATTSVDDFFRHDRYAGLALSPDGQFIAALAPVNGRRNVAVLDLKAGSVAVITSLRERDVRTVRWINNERLVFDLIDLQSGLGEQRPSGLFAINRDGKEARELVAASVASPGSAKFVYRPTLLLSALPDSSDILVMATDRTVESFDVYRMDTYTGRKTLVTFDNPGFVYGWLLDSKRQPRLAIAGIEGTTRTAIHYRASAEGPWIKLAEFDGLSNEGFDPLAFGPDDTLYVASRAGSDKAAIYTYDLKANRLGERQIAHKDYDFGYGNRPLGGDLTDLLSNRNFNLIFDSKKKKLVGARQYAEREEFFWFDEEWSRLHAMVNGALPQRTNRLTRSTDSASILVYSYSDRDPGRWYLLDAEKRSLQELVARRPWIDVQQMAQKTPIRYKARDGIEIPAYLTLPPGRDKQLPLVLIVHGGPFVRGEFWGWDREAQFLASRGYAVLQVDYRGSLGYGWNHHRLGRRQWGLAMQDDLTDGVNHLVAQGIADKSRVAIMGGSYGGYATMMGLAKDPDLYRCGINIVGVTDLALMGTATWSDMSVESKEFQIWFAQHVGDPAKERDKLDAASPARLADRIRRPVLIAHGYNDVRVPIEHAHRMRAALDRAGMRDVEWVVYPDEAHGILREKNASDLYSRIERFLAKHMA